MKYNLRLKKATTKDLSSKKSVKKKISQGFKELMFSKSQQTIPSIPITNADNQAYTGESRTLTCIRTNDKTTLGVSCEQTTPSTPVNNTYVQTYTNESQVLTFIWTKNETFNSVSCLNDDAFWSCGHDDNTLRLYNHQGVLIQLVGTKSGYELWDIAVTTDRNLCIHWPHWVSINKKYSMEWQKQLFLFTKRF